MKPRGDFSVKQGKTMSPSIPNKRKKKQSGIGKEINYKNVKKAVKKKLITDLNNQTFFKNLDGTYSSLFDVGVEKKKRKLINFLLDQGINLNIVERGQPSLLKKITSESKFRDDVDLIRRMINAGADVNHQEFFIPRVQSYLTRLVNYFPNIAQLLIESGANVNPPCVCRRDSTSMCLPFPAAVSRKCDKIINLLLKKGVDINRRCGEGSSALMEAVINNNIGLTKHLLDLGAFVNELYGRGETVLHSAVEYDQSEMAQTLLSHELIDLDIRNFRFNGTVLHVAVGSMALNCIDFVLDANPDVNHFNTRNELAVEIFYDNNEYKAKSQVAIEKLEKHLVRLRAAGCHLIDRNLAAISGEKYQDLYAECCQQVNLMKETPISSESHLNFYDLLFINEQKLSLCLESLNDRGILQSGFEKKFSLYAGMIQYKLNKANGWIKLREALNEAVNILFKNDLPVPIMEMLYKYFTVYELKKLRTYLKKNDSNSFRMYSYDD